VFIESYHPRSFRERGVAAPFTTPMLAGARLRVAETRGTPVLEVAIPNPSRRRGTYVLAWNERRTLCRPTLFDTRLGDVLAARPDLAALSPAMVRRVAWAIAAGGLAGPAAAAAAGRAMLDERRRVAAARAGLPSHAAIDRLAAAMADVLPCDGAAPPVPGLLESVLALARELDGWAGQRSEPPAVAARAIAAAAERAHTAGSKLMEAALARAQTPADLAAAWRDDPVGLTAELARADWLLDGWERLVLLWRDGEPERATALAEMAAALPAWPDEAEAWLGLPPDAAQRMLPPPPFLQLPPSDPLALMEQIARNERLRGLAA
jgi:hypothetical protein